MWQDEFHAHMKKQFPVLKRGESSLVTKRKHIPTWLFKQSADLSKQQKAIEQILSDINPINAGKNCSGMDIPGYVFESLARCLLPKIQQYYENEKGQKAFTEWKEQHKQKSDK